MTRCAALKSFKDPVHGYCDICSTVARIVDRWYVQRLRWIRQTGFAHLVYHGMEHSRFNHSLGVAHLAREVLGFMLGNARQYYPAAGSGELNALEEAVEVFQLAALIHDLGHLPFSHSSEAGIQEASTLYQVEGFDRLPRRHEAYTQSLIPLVASDAVEAGIEPVFSDKLEEDLASIIMGPGEPGRSRGLASTWCATNVLNRLLAGGIDVDRMDYLLRDSIYAGVRYGVFDVDRLARTLIATPLVMGAEGSVDSSESCSVAVLDKGVSIVESFLLARFYMFSEVYLHRVVEAYNSLYARLFALLARDQVITLLGGGGELQLPLPEQLTAMDQDALRAWESLDDTAMLTLLRRVRDGALPGKVSAEARKLADRLLNRRHPRTLLVIDDSELWGSYKAFLEGSRNMDQDRVQAFQQLIEIQRENPSIIVRPLRVDLLSLKDLRVYLRAERRTISLEDAEAREAGKLGRLYKLAGLGVYRIAVFAYPEDAQEAAKAVQLLRQLASGRNRGGKEQDRGGGV